MTAFKHRITLGWIHRHLPPRSTVGIEIALLDIAQDFLLAALHDEGLFDDLLVFKGGTAIRKMWAGAAGRFSTDIDFAAGHPGTDRNAAAALVARAVQRRRLGPFEFTASERRGRWHLAVASEFGSPRIAIKVDVGPPPWLRPEHRRPVETGIHSRYDFAMPAVPTVPMEETLAEKVARLNRQSTARDAYDLVWAASAVPTLVPEPARLRRMAVLKTWVDANGLGLWPPARNSRRFDPEVWLAARIDWDDQAIGLLASPPPPLPELGSDLSDRYRWLADLSPDEAQWAEAHVGDRADVIQAIADLPGAALTPAELWGR